VAQDYREGGTSSESCPRLAGLRAEEEEGIGPEWRNLTTHPPDTKIIRLTLLWRRNSVV
jgi:hypothetical protein